MDTTLLDITTVTKEQVQELLDRYEAKVKERTDRTRLLQRRLERIQAAISAETEEIDQEIAIIREYIDAGVKVLQTSIGNDSWLAVFNKGKEKVDTQFIQTWLKLHPEHEELSQAFSRGEPWVTLRERKG